MLCEQIMNNLSRERFTCYILPETLKRIEAASKGRPLGYAVDDAFEEPVTPPVQKLLTRNKTDRVPVRPVLARSGPTLTNPKARQMGVVTHTAQTTVPMMRPVHPISCPCDACTVARLNSPQVKKSK